MSERRYSGRAASPGIALGELVVVAGRPAPAERRGAAERPLDAAALHAAIAAARAELEALAGRARGDGADILGFQIALLDDPALAEPALAEIARGRPADEAWSAALRAEAEGYEASADEHFRARAADLLDVQDRVLGHLTGDRGAGDVPPGAVVAAADLAPSRFLAIDWSRGGALALTGGSAASHVAMLARSRGVPALVGLDAPLGELGPRRAALLDASRGLLVVEPGPAERERYERERTRLAGERAAAEVHAARPAATRDGTPVRVLLNVSDPGELEHLDPAVCDGVGLVRTELLFHGGALPGEEEQLAAYRRVVEWARGRPVTLRTLDAGGDKPIPGLTPEGESNPFLGVRGIRLSLARPDVFRVQLRALARAAVLGDVKVMLPMVGSPRELARARALLDEEVASLAAAGVAARRPPLGMMVEVPAAAIAADLFDAEFYSIGSNDLTQYVAAAGRDVDALAELADPAQPAVLRLVRRVAEVGAARGVEVSLCGDAGGDPQVVPLLLAAGIRALSVAPPLVGRVKQSIAGVDLRELGGSPWGPAWPI